MKPKRKTATKSKRTTKTADTKRAVKRSAKKSPRPPSRKPIVIDVHAHIVVPEVLEFAYKQSLFAKTVGAAQGGVPAPLIERMTNHAARFADMDAMGVDIQVISPSILQTCTYWAEPQDSLRMERLGNERVAEAVAKYPHRLIGLGSLPMQDVSLACAELERCVRHLRLKGVIISSFIEGAEIGDAKFRPFWATAEKLGAVIFVHPAGSPDPRMARHRLLITLGQPLEEAFAQSSLVYEGVLDAHPKLKILMAHGGGFLPFYTGRHDNNFRNWGSHPQMKGDFTSYLRHFYYDTVLFNPDMLEFLAQKVPAERILLATNYPFAEKAPVEFVRRAKRIPREVQDAILGANAARMLGVGV